tara:strand:- start:2494 stop:2682 length:189 start_codon:yes stop_codon:yes gene_type:complete
MGNTYKDKSEFLPLKKSKVKKNKPLHGLKEATYADKQQGRSYNTMDFDDYDEDNFEKFSKKR